MASSSCAQRSPGFFPWGICGSGEVIDGAMQQAPQPGRQLGSAPDASGRLAASEQVRSIHLKKAETFWLKPMADPRATPLRASP
jgi:hypothetical protein